MHIHTPATMVFIQRQFNKWCYKYLSDSRYAAYQQRNQQQDGIDQNNTN